MAPADWAESRLRISSVLGRKASLPRRIGLEGRESVWRWRIELAAGWEGRPVAEGVARIDGATPALLVALVAERDDVRVPAVGVVDPAGGWSEDPAAIKRILEAAGGAVGSDLGPAELALWSKAVGPMARAVLGRVASESIAGNHRSPESRAMTDRLRAEMREAVRQRDVAKIKELDQLATFVARGHTAGEELQIREAYLGNDGRVPGMLDGLRTAEAVKGPWRVRLVAAIATSGASPGRASPAPTASP